MSAADIRAIRAAHQIGRHLMAAADSPRHCRRCSTFEEYCKDIDCEPDPKSKRWWPQGRAMMRWEK